MIKQNVLIYLFLFFFTTVQAQQALNVYVFIAEECPISIYMVKPLNEVAKLDLANVKYTAVFPKKNSTKATAQQFLDKYQLNNFDILLDPNQSFAEKMGASITPEVIITDQEQSILYRGRISNAYAAPGKMKHGTRKNDLKKVLTELSANKSIAQPWPKAVGCYITFYNK